MQAFIPTAPLGLQAQRAAPKLHSLHRELVPNVAPFATLPQTASAQAASQQTAPTRTALGRGALPPRRQTGLYELEREGIDPQTLISEDSPEENAFAGVIALFVGGLTLLPVLTPFPVEGPAAAVAGVLLAGWAIDALALNGVLSGALAISLQNRRRVACHEAGHMVVGHLLGLRATSYTLPSASNALNGVTCGVEFDSGGDGWAKAAVGLAGIAAEVVTYGGSLGGAADLRDVGKAVRGMALGKEGRKGVVRWGLLAGVRLIREHREAHKRVCEVMLRGGSLEECLTVLEGAVDRGRLAGAETR